MEKMATNKSHNKSPNFKMGQLWTQISDTQAQDGDETEEEEDVNRDNNETMKLRREDMSLFGICPAWDQFYLVVCEYCKQVIKPQALQQHIELRHSYHKHISNQINNNSLKLRTDSTNTANITTNTPSNRKSPSITTITENGSDIKSNNDNNDKIVNKLPKSDVKLMLSSTNIKPIVDNSVVVVDNSVDINCVNSNELIETNSPKTKTKSKLINLLSPNINTTIEPLIIPEPTGPGPGFATVVSADANSITISVPEIDFNDKIEVKTEPELPAVVAKPAPKKKSYKKSMNPRKLLPCKDRLYDPNKHCGVCIPDSDKPCTRSLTCKTHSLTLRRSVQGRLKNFDELLSEHREAKEAALRAQGIEVKPTKKAIQKQQQQHLRASQLQMKSEHQNQQLITSDNSNCQPMTRTLVFSESQSIVSNVMTNSNTNSLLTSVSSPVCSSIENVRTRDSQQSQHKLLNQIEVEPNGTVHMWCHPRPAAVCNHNIRTFNGSRLLSRNCDLTLSALKATFNSPLLVSKLNNQKCSSTLSPLSIKSPLRNTNQSYSPNKKLCTSLDSDSFDSPSDGVVDPYNFADAITTNNNNYTYVKPKTTIAKSPSNPSKKKKKSDINCSTDTTSLLSNGQLFHTSNTNKTIGSTAKKRTVVKKNANNSHNTSISATIPLTNSNNITINSTNNSNCEQLTNPSTSLISEVSVPHRNLNDILSNSIDSCKSDNGSLLLNGSLLSCKRNTLSVLSKQSNTDFKDSINKKTIFPAKSFNNNNKFLVNNLNPLNQSLSSISSTLSVSPNSRQLIQKQTLPSTTVNTLSQSQNMSQISQNIHNTTHTIFIKSAKQSLQNQLMPAITSPKLLSKTKDFTT